MQEVGAEHHDLLEVVNVVTRDAALLFEQLLDGNDVGALEQIGGRRGHQIENLGGVRIDRLYSQEHARGHIDIADGETFGNLGLGEVE